MGFLWSAGPVKTDLVGVGRVGSGGWGLLRRVGGGHVQPARGPVDAGARCAVRRRAAAREREPCGLVGRPFVGAWGGRGGEAGGRWDRVANLRPEPHIPRRVRAYVCVRVFLSSVSTHHSIVQPAKRLHLSSPRCVSCRLMRMRERLICMYERASPCIRVCAHASERRCIVCSVMLRAVYVACSVVLGCVQCMCARVTGSGQVRGVRVRGGVSGALLRLRTRPLRRRVPSPPPPPPSSPHLVSTALAPPPPPRHIPSR